MADTKQNEAVQKELAAGKKLKEEIIAAAAERVKWKPTPTQEENDRAKLGEHILNHDADGSPEDTSGFLGTRHSTAGGAAPYATRDMGASHRPQRQQS